MIGSIDYGYALCPTSQFYFCSVPFRLDISPNCTTGCQYCFSMARGGKRSVKNCIINPNLFARKLENTFSGIRKTDINSELLLSRMPIHLGGMSDPFACREYTAKTINIISAMHRFDYPLIISSKHTEMIIRDDVLSALKKLKHLILQISIPIPDDKYSARIEPGAPVFSHRMADIRMLSAEGIDVVARLQPLLPPFLHRVKNEVIYGLKEAGCAHVIIESLKIPLEKSSRINTLFNEICWDGNEYYSKRNSLIVGRDRVLPPLVALEHIYELVIRLQELSMTYGLTDHGLFHLSSSPCCCGVSHKDGFEGIFKGNFTNAIRTATSDMITFSDVAKYWIPRKSITRYLNSHSRLQGENTIFTHLRDKWNKPGNANAPDAFLGLRYTGERDENGDCIYDKSNINSYAKFF
jgi:DNA repair photolyase